MDHMQWPVKVNLFTLTRVLTLSNFQMTLKKNTEIISNTDYTWIKRSVYCSPVNGDLLIGMSRGDPLFWMHRVFTDKSKVNRYDQNGQLKQSIEFDNEGLELYSSPHKITENNNEDVVVSDLSGAVVVTDSGGRYRFSYTGHPLGSGMRPRGVCTDALSRILVCDSGSKSIQLIDKNGHFQQFFLTTIQDEDMPSCLSYDIINNLLLIGSPQNNKICVYKYLTKHNIEKGKLTELFGFLRVKVQTLVKDTV